MTTYIAVYGNGTRRLFDATSKSAASALAFSYGRRNACGMLLTVNRY